MMKDKETVKGRILNFKEIILKEEKDFSQLSSVDRTCSEVGSWLKPFLKKMDSTWIAFKATGPFNVKVTCTSMDSLMDKGKAMVMDYSASSRVLKWSLDMNQ
ncbi:hypothetical protein ACH5RR_009261 [Cinchona calisaya]|uniref:Uncharacterized protein n=1 Tax=Cinchona calisaya TaxID=153742 RepID=A0ABD3AFG2_9GENT